MKEKGTNKIDLGRREEKSYRFKEYSQFKMIKIIVPVFVQEKSCLYFLIYYQPSIRNNFIIDF